MNELTVLLASQYKRFGKAFIQSLIKFKSQRSVAQYAVCYFETFEPYQEDEKINRFVEGLEYSLLLKRVLVMIKKIIH